MKKTLTILLVLFGTPFLIAKLIDIHLPSGEELYIEREREKERENNKARDTLNSEDASHCERTKAYNTLLDNGAQA